MIFCSSPLMKCSFPFVGFQVFQQPCQGQIPLQQRLWGGELSLALQGKNANHCKTARLTLSAVALHDQGQHWLRHSTRSRGAVAFTPTFHSVPWRCRLARSVSLQKTSKTISVGSIAGIVATSTARSDATTIRGPDKSPGATLAPTFHSGPRNTASKLKEDLL